MGEICIWWEFEDADCKKLNETNEKKVSAAKVDFFYVVEKIFIIPIAHFFVASYLHN